MQQACHFIWELQSWSSFLNDPLPDITKWIQCQRNVCRGLCGTQRYSSAATRATSSKGFRFFLEAHGESALHLLDKNTFEWEVTVTSGGRVEGRKSAPAWCSIFFLFPENPKEQLQEDRFSPPLNTQKKKIHVKSSLFNTHCTVFCSLYWF